MPYGQKTAPKKEALADALKRQKITVKNSNLAVPIETGLIEFYRSHREPRTAERRLPIFRRTPLWRNPIAVSRGCARLSSAWPCPRALARYAWSWRSGA